MMRGYSAAGLTPTWVSFRYCSASRVCWRPGNRLLYWSGSASASAAFWLTLDMFSFHSFTTLEEERQTQLAWVNLKEQESFSTLFALWPWEIKSDNYKVAYAGVRQKQGLEVSHSTTWGKPIRNTFTLRLGWACMFLPGKQPLAIDQF